jgi:hypothetical protein
MNNSAGDKHVTVGTDHDRLRLASHRSAKQDQCQGLCNQQIDVSAVDNRDIEATRCLYPINAGEYGIMLCERDFTAAERVLSRAPKCLKLDGEQADCAE